MQLQIKLIKEIRSYSQTIYFGLNAKQLCFSICAILCAVGVYLLLRDRLSQTTISLVCILAAAPGAFFGFFQFQGMTAAEFLWVIIKFFLLQKKLPYISSFQDYEGRDRS